MKETLLTDLAKSQRLTLLTGSGVSGTAPAAYTLTGSCLFVDQNVIINLRLVNRAGNTVPGAAENVEGSRSEVFRLLHVLAGKFTARITGESFAVPSVHRPISGQQVVEPAVNRQEPLVL